MYGPFIPVDNRRVFPVPDAEHDPATLRTFFHSLKPAGRSGRKPLLTGELNGKPCMVRRFHHGGVFRHLFKDRFWERVPRAVLELRLLEDLAGLGLPVVTPVMAWVEPMGWTYRQGLVTETREDGVDLLAIKELDRAMLVQLVEQLEAFFDAGLVHPDLNIKNILWVRGEEQFCLLDFDKAKRRKQPLTVNARATTYRRMFRSFDKMGRLDDWSGFDWATVPHHVEKAYRQYFKVRGFRAFLWKLNRK